MSGSRILVTGGAGFIGSHLVPQLVTRGHSVRVLDNLCSQVHGTDPSSTSPLYASIIKEIEFVRASVTSRAAWQAALEGRDVVIHLAAETGTSQSMYMAENYSDVNIRGLAVLLDLMASRECAVRKVVLASSRAVYGEGKYRHPTQGIVYPSSREEKDLLAGKFEVMLDDGVPLLPQATDEMSVVHPSSVYAITKRVQEDLLKVIAKEYGMDWVVFRYQNVYGPGQALGNPYTGIFPQFIRSIRLGDPICIFEDGRQSRDFVYVEDVVRATIAGVEDDRAVGTTFNVGSGTLTTIRQAAELLMKKLGRNVPIHMPGSARGGDIRHCFADISLLANRLGIKPAVSLDEGVGRLVEWVRRQ